MKTCDKPICNPAKSAETLKLEEFFILDAEDAINILETLYPKIQACEQATCSQSDFSDDDKNSFVTTVHGIKSALANIGEKELSGFALKLEKAGDEMNLDIMLNETPVLIKSLKSLIDKLKPKKNDIDERIPGEEDQAYLHEKLLVIKAACEKFDKKSANIALEELKQKSWHHDINDVLNKITLNILHSAFKKAAAEAETAANSVNNSGFD